VVEVVEHDHERPFQLLCRLDEREGRVVAVGGERRRGGSKRANGLDDAVPERRAVTLVE
jgi:hypothetical protein